MVVTLINHLICILQKIEISNFNYIFNIKFLLSFNIMESISNLTSIQNKALEFVNKKAKIHEKNTQHIVKLRLLDLNLKMTISDIQNYFKNNIKTTINIRLETILVHLLYSPILKNLFEVNGCSEGRIEWESNLFNKIYDEAENYERVKYGALNVFQSKKGIKSCRIYGECVMILRDEVKKRSSFVNGDSCLLQLHICNFNYIIQLLVHVSDQFLINLNKVIEFNSNEINGVNEVNEFNEFIESLQYDYVEVQIHGNINIDLDVEKILIPREKYIINELNINLFKLYHPDIEIEQI